MAVSEVGQGLIQVFTEPSGKSFEFNGEIIVASSSMCSFDELIDSLAASLPLHLEPNFWLDVTLKFNRPFPQTLLDANPFWVDASPVGYRLIQCKIIDITTSAYTGDINTYEMRLISVKFLHPDDRLDNANRNIYQAT